MKISLKTVLCLYAKRNTTIGYCQGLNFIVQFLIDCNFNNEVY